MHVDGIRKVVGFLNDFLRFIDMGRGGSFSIQSVGLESFTFIFCLLLGSFIKIVVLQPLQFNYIHPY